MATKQRSSTRVKSEAVTSMAMLQSPAAATAAAASSSDSKRSSLSSQSSLDAIAADNHYHNNNGSGNTGSSGSGKGNGSRDPLLPPLAALGSRSGMDRFSLKPSLSELIRPHIHSFNFFLQHKGGLAQTVEDLRHGLIDPQGDFPGCSFYIENVTVASPQRATTDMVSSQLLPRECRELGLSYAGVMTVKLIVQTHGPNPQTLSIIRPIGSIPLMVRAHKCHLESMTVNQLLTAREEGNEQGGYFVVGGIERIIRILILPRRNTVWALVRSAFQNRGKFYTQMATSIRCVRPDQWSKTITVHYLSSGAANLRVSIKKQEFFIPAVYVLRALVDTTDKEIYDGIVQGDTGNAFVTDRTELLIRDGKTVHLPTRKDVLAWIGKSFRLVLRPEDSVTDEDVGRMLIDEHIFIHCLDTDETIRNRTKFNILLYMIQKVYSLAQGKIRADNADALSTQEVLLPGHLYGSILKEKLIDWIAGIKGYIKKDLRLAPNKVEITKEVYWRKAMDAQADIGKRLEHFLKTGTLTSNTGLDLMQVTGFTIIADKLNYVRFLSHFRSVHRGQFFTTMKTTTVRKLLPESWGFMCPVHTPDGSPCGLLNHLAARCDPVTHHPDFDRKALIGVLIDLGMVPITPPVVLPPSYLPVLLDGIVVGRLAPGLAQRFGHQLRLLKVQAGYREFKKMSSGDGESVAIKPLAMPDHSPMVAKVPHTMEIHIVVAAGEPVYPSVILSTDSGRLVRPVQYLATADHRQSYIEWVGPMEQVYMDIAATPADFRAGETTHQELYPEIMLSETAMCTPFSDFNQSPRNMYQCQMGKQTMGTPFHSHVHRTDNKSYRLQTPQKPIVANGAYDEYDMDEYPQGANAVVAVISYTGFDMEDAMIINKSSYERGFGHASLYKYKKVDLREERVKGETIHERFKNVVDDKKSASRGGKEKKGTTKKLHEMSLDSDGLPFVGQRLVKDNPYYVTHNDVSDRYASHKFKEGEPAVVDEVRILDLGKEHEVQTIGLKLRINRNPIIGDKFSSRHGQKGVLSVLWPQEDMPFSESGMSPDVIINPHAFPSRMTIGMLVESLAGKSGSLHGHTQSGTPFRFSEKQRAVDHFGKELVAAGYNYAGTEPLYSGISGVEMRAEIYIGVVYYQRLRHMVSDKSQVRSTGPVNSTHRQPVKGRKVGGGIRFGEMERDSLLAHGAAYLLHDRLMMCSDYHTGYVCTLCGSLLSPMMSNPSLGNKAGVICRNCETARGCSLIAIPYVFIYLVNELAAMNIRLTLDVKETGAEANQ